MRGRLITRGRTTGIKREAENIHSRALAARAGLEIGLEVRLCLVVEGDLQRHVCGTEEFGSSGPVLGAVEGGGGVWI